MAIDRLSPYRAWSGSRLTPATIETPGVRSALDYVEAYLAGRPDPSSPSSWKGMLIVGQLGIGKTHLAQVIAHRIIFDETSKIRPLILDSPAGDFATIYRTTLVGQLDRFDLYNRLKDYYAMVLADDLEGSKATSGLAEGLRQGVYDPRKVVEHFGLVESALRDQLRRHLLRVTEIANFSKAFTLALIPEHEQSVWEWLQGRPASKTLQQYGITTLIDGESSAFDALNVLAFVYGRVGYRFVFIIDEFDKLLAGSDDRRTQLVKQSVERMLNVFIDSNGLVVMCAMPEIQQSLPASTRERLRTYRLAPFTTAELGQYVHNALDSEAHRFPAGPIAYIEGLTSGIPRQAITLCGQVWGRAERDQLPVNNDLVRTVVREQYERSSFQDVRASVRQVIQAAGLSWKADHRLEGVIVDFWIPLWEDGPGVAVMIVGSVLQQEDLEEIGRRLEEAPRLEVILVVNGFLSAALREEAASLLGRQPLVYEEEPFNEMLRGQVTATLRRIESTTQEDHMTTLRRHVDRLALQQAYTQSFMEQMSGRIDRFGGEANRRLAFIERGISEVRTPLPPGASQRLSAGGPLPEELQWHFDRALTAVQALGGLNDLFKEAFASASPGLPRRRLASRALFEAAGVAVVFQRLIESFREAVAEWLRTAHRDDEPRPLSREQEERLRLICRTYTTTAEVLPLFQLESLALTAAPYATETSATEQTSRSIRRGEAAQALDNLGDRVLGAALAAARP
ncbi:unnamed protein product [[Actinomadura] parvosata subsp. kistnae]|uniref:hypothetical protein n=1 Tax=[Actinomadura] parvosata TaxID=1955412 RepID=UPI000D28BF3E|nr:hypothetical protein [Nonomuraea sp. ATCC 55076]SPL91380.1 unnamed protein product [Actinomadura parvosata subsp. kistnae]